MSTSNIIARQVTLVVAGKTEAAFQDALAEATRLVNEGNLSGTNSNEEGVFYFNSHSHVHEAHLPHMG